MPLPTFEFGFAFFQKSLHALVLVFTREDEREEIHFAAQTFVEVRSRSELHRFFGEAQSDRTLLGNPIRNLHSPRLELIRRHHVIHQADRERSLRVDDLARQDHLDRFAFADQTSQPLRAAAARNNSEIDFGLAERSFVAGDAHVARERDFTTAAEAIAVHHRDDWLRKTIDGVEKRSIQHHFALLNRGALGELGDVRAGDESFVACRGNSRSPSR